MEITEEEMQKRIDEAVAKREADLKKQHDADFAEARKRAKEEQDRAIEKAVAESKLTAEQKAQKDFEEKQKAQEQELNELRAYKKSGELEKKLVEKGLPTFFKNDSRLINAKDEEVESVISTIEADYKATLPTQEGARVSTNLGGGKPSSEEEELARVRKLGLHK